MQVDRTIPVKMLDSCLLDYLPGVSTVSNMEVLVAKALFSKSKAIDMPFHYHVKHVKRKEMSRTLIGLIPILGNVALLVSDCREVKKDEFRFTRNLHCAQEFAEIARSVHSLYYVQWSRMITDLKDNQYCFCRALQNNQRTGQTESPLMIMTKNSSHPISITSQGGIRLGNERTFDSFEDLFIYLGLGVHPERRLM